MDDSSDLKHMQAAIDLALHSVTVGGGPFGAVVVKDGEVIGRGHNRVTLDNDPTAHAEVMAIRAACASLGSFRLDGCTLYTSCMPCPMCLGAAYWAHVSALVYAATPSDAAEAGFDDALIYHELTLPPEQRTLPLRQLSRDTALDTFAVWHARQDKTRY